MAIREALRPELVLVTVHVKFIASPYTVYGSIGASSENNNAICLFTILQKQTPYAKIFSITMLDAKSRESSVGYSKWKSQESHSRLGKRCIVHKQPKFENYLGQMYPVELEIKDTTESTTSASYLDLLLSIGRDGQLRTSIYDNRNDFNFHITNFPFLSSDIPSSPVYGVFISQLIRYARACSSYECFILRARRLSSKLLKQGYLVERLKSSFQEVLWSIRGS